jgi:hypothetical protein
MTISITENQWKEQQAGIKTLKARIRELEEEITMLVTEIAEREISYNELEIEYSVYQMNNPDNDRDKGSDG